jgi:hypothetical protein
VFVPVLVSVFVSVFVGVFVSVFVGVLLLVGVFAGVLGAGMNIELDALDLAAFGAMGVEMVAVQGKFRQFQFHLAEFHAQIQHGPHEHVSADAAENIQIQCFQSFDLRADDASSLIWLAAYPAPKPLSILTTVTPLPQLLSMASKAANPPKLAPYPTLVGTAMTGRLTRPATTLGSAPSIPATTTST